MIESRDAMVRALSFTGVPGWVEVASYGSPIREPVGRGSARSVWLRQCSPVGLTSGPGVFATGCGPGHNAMTPATCSPLDGVDHDSIDPRPGCWTVPRQGPQIALAILAMLGAHRGRRTGHR